MENSLIFTGLILLAGLAGGLIGNACAKGRQAGDHEGRIAELEDRLDALATHSMDEEHKLRGRLDEVEFLIGETPTGGLLGRVGALEEAQKTHEQDAVIVNGWAEEIKTLKKEMEGLVMVNDAEHHALLEHQKCIVKDMKEAKDAQP